MSEPTKNLFETLRDFFREIIREEITAALNVKIQQDEHLLDVEEAAEFLRQSPDWVYKNWRRIGGRKLGPKSVRFARADLQRWIQSRRTG